MHRLIATIFLTLSLVQGCTVADVAYHRVCGTDVSCSDDKLQKAITVQTDVEIRNDGWGACLDDKTHSLLKSNSELVQYSRCENFDPSSLLPVSYSHAWLEYREDGQRQEVAQRDAILHWIQSESGPLYIVVYIHGWHHNADESNGDPRNNAIKFSFLMARQVDTLKRMALDNKAPMPKVLGIYVGWRGEAYTDPVRKLFSIDGRSKVADEIGSAGVLKSDLMDIAQAMRVRDPDSSRMVVLGHSLGGRMLTSMFKKDLWSGHPQPLGSNTVIVTLNSAVGADCFDGVFAEGGKNPDAPSPRWINITSEDDSATTWIYATAGHLGLVNSCNADSPAQGRTIGHYRPYFRQVIDQASSGHSDETVDSTVAEKSALWEPTWYKERAARLFMKFPIRTDATLDPFHANYRSVNVGIENCELPDRVLDRSVWNVRSDKSLFDFDVDGDNIGGFHNGIISTTLVRLLTEMAYPPAQ